MRIAGTALPIVAACAAVAMLSSAPDTVAHERPAVEGAKEPAVVAALRANGARILALGERGGLSGHFVELGDGDAYGLYLTPDGHAVVGLLYGPDGTLVTADQLAAARDAAGDEASTARPTVGNTATDEAPPAPARLAHLYEDGPEAPNAEALFERSGAAFGFTLGRTGPLVVLFADPGCRWSRSAAARLGQAALDGRLRLRVVPVAVLGAASAQEAAAIASASDPALAWFEGTYVPGDAEGGRRIAGNNTLYDRWGVDAVPLIAWRARDGRIAHRLGDIDDLGAWLGALPHE